MIRSRKNLRANHMRETYHPFNCIRQSTLEILKNKSPTPELLEICKASGIVMFYRPSTTIQENDYSIRHKGYIVGFLRIPGLSLEILGGELIKCRDVDFGLYRRDPRTEFISHEYFTDRFNSEYQCLSAIFKSGCMIQPVMNGLNHSDSEANFNMWFPFLGNYLYKDYQPSTDMSVVMFFVSDNTFDAAEPDACVRHLTKALKRVLGTSYAKTIPEAV